MHNTTAPFVRMFSSSSFDGELPTDWNDVEYLSREFVFSELVWAKVVNLFNVPRLTVQWELSVVGKFLSLEFVRGNTHPILLRI